ncbi:MAG: sulfatase-like hydrolase/transferase [Luteolibacter sp.]
MRITRELQSLTAAVTMTTMASAQAMLLFQDDFNATNGTSLTVPATRATGSLATTVNYAWTDTTQVVVDGTLNWDSNGDRNGQHQQTDSGSNSQNFRMTYNWAPQVAGKVWEVEFDQRVGWNHPLTFGLSDNAQNGLWSAWDDVNYDFATGSYGTALRYDTDNEGGASGPAVSGVFPALVATDPPTNQVHHFRIRFDEPAGTATVWINGVQKVQVATLDFENTGRYLSWGEPQQYAGALDNITVSVIETPPSIIGYSPVQGADGVYPGATLVATFDKAIALPGGGSILLDDTIGSNDIVINVADSSQLAVSGSDLVITPPTSPAFATTYEVIIGAGTVADASNAGNAFAGTTAGQWTFSTAAQQFTAPVITSTTPDDDAIDALPSANLVASFDQNITAGTGDIVIVDTTDGATTKTIPVTDGSQVSIAGNILTINPNTSLSPGKNYAVQIAAGAVRNYSDLDFAGIASLTDWNFTTTLTSKVVLHEWDVGAAGNSNTLWADPIGGKNLAASAGAGGSTSVVFTQDPRVSIGRAFQATTANLNAGAASGLPTASYTFEWWLHFGGSVTQQQVVFESGGGTAGIGLWTTNGGLEWANSSSNTGSNVLASVSLAGLDLTHYVQVVGLCDTGNDSITLQVTDVNGVSTSATAVSAQPIGLGTGNGMGLFAGGNGTFGNTLGNVGGSSATGVSLATPAVFSGKIGLCRVWEGVDLPAVSESYDAIVLDAVRSNDPRPNVIVIFTDDHGYADLGVQGQDAGLAGLTPNIDRLGTEGVRFTSGYVSAPQCVPSRAGLLSGRYQQRFGVDQNGLGPLPLEVTTIAERLRKAGYRTGMTGKWHLEPNQTDTEWMTENGYPDFAAVPTSVKRMFLPDQQGFEEFAEGYTNSYWRNFQRNGSNGTPLGSQNSESDHRIDIQSDFAVSFIQRNFDRPFFFYLSYYGPHVPLTWVSRYNNASFHPGLPTNRRIALSMIKAVDDGVQRILAELTTRGIDQKTLIWFIGDNGAPLGFAEAGNVGATDASTAWDGSLNTPWTGEKGMLAEGGIRVPFLMRWAGTVTPQVYDQPVISLDVAATTNALAGLDETTELDGTNLIPHLTGADPAPPHDRLFWRFWDQCAVREGKWKYLKPSAATPPMLFDMESPDHELENLIGRHPDIAASFDSKVEAWKSGLERSGDLGPSMNASETAWYRRHMGVGLAYEFASAGNDEGWTPLGVTTPRVEDGSWKGATAGGSSITQEDFASKKDFLVVGATVDRVLVKLKSPASGSLEMQWAHRDDDTFSVSRSISLPVSASPNPQWFAFPVDEEPEWNRTMVTRVRFVFTSSGGDDLEIDSIRASDGDYDRDGIDDLDDGTVDTDGDGNANLEDLDSDGNGQPDHVSWLLGTDHTNPGSYLPSEPVYQDGTLHLDFSAIPGRLYTLQQSNELTGLWTDSTSLGPVGGPGVERLSFTPPPGSPRWFVRLKVAAAP